MKAVALILTSLTFFCEFPQNIMHKFSCMNCEALKCKFPGSSLSEKKINIIRKSIRNKTH